MPPLASLVSPRSVALSTGVTLPYIDVGDPDGTPVVFLHGFTDSWRSYEPVLPFLPEGIRAIVPTLRGHGEAGRPASGYAPADLAADVAALLDAIGLERVVIMGHSMGSTVAQRFALDFPDRTLGVVLEGSAASWRGKPVVLELWEAVAGLTDPVDPEFVRAFQLSTMAQPVDPDYVDTVVEESLRVPARVWQAALGELKETDLSDQLRAITAPALILWGDQDEVAGWGDQIALRDAIPGARHVTYTGAGHALHWEEPARFAADVAGFAVGIVS